MRHLVVRGAAIAALWAASPLSAAPPTGAVAPDVVLADDIGAGGEPASLPQGVRVLRGLPYGADPLQTMDVYLPPRAREGAGPAPVLLMVHGGAWMLGDKAARAVVANKVARWVTRGMVLVSVNYRLVPQAAPLEQARDVARALAAAQDRAADWGAARSRFILMGHSSGAHLVALLAAAPALASDAGGVPWLGTVLLDSAALDVVALMEAPHPRFYDRAFGRDPQAWRAASPAEQLSRAGAPILAVCSSRRADACPQAQRFVARATALGTRAQVLAQPLSHGDINAALGQDEAYTRAVEAVLGRFDPGVAALLGTVTR